MRALVLVFALFAFSTSILASEPAPQVSLVELIAAPARFEGQRVVVIAYLKLEFEGNALYVHREDFEQGIFKNGLWLEVNREEMQRYSESSGKYVLAEGTFTTTSKGHRSLWSGSLKDISSVTARRPREVAP
jgi:hypothetical protein